MAGGGGREPFFYREKCGKKVDAETREGDDEGAVEIKGGERGESAQSAQGAQWRSNGSWHCGRRVVPMGLVSASPGEGEAFDVISPRIGMIGCGKWAVQFLSRNFERLFEKWKNLLESGDFIIEPLNKFQIVQWCLHISEGKLSRRGVCLYRILLEYRSHEWWRRSHCLNFHNSRFDPQTTQRRFISLRKWNKI